MDVGDDYLGHAGRQLGRQGGGKSSAASPVARTGPGVALDGKPKFNLEKYDPEYFRRLRDRIAAAGRRGIYVSIMLFEGWALQFADKAWPGHPMHPANHIQGVDDRWPAADQGVRVHELGCPQLTRLQEAYVRHVIDTVHDLDNVLFEISNENHPASTAWQYHMIDYIHAYERTLAQQHPVGMTFQYKGGSNRTLFESPADWISPNPDGGYRDNPPANDGHKVILSDTDHLWGIGGNTAWVWKSLLRGMNPLFMDPYDGSVLGKRFDPQWDPVRKSLGYALRLSADLNLGKMIPHNKLATTPYCLADPGREYLVFLAGGGETKLDLSALGSRARMRWMRAEDGTWHAAGTTTGGSTRTFRAPFQRDALLHIKAEGNS